MWRSLFKRSGKDNCERTKERLSAHIDQRLSLTDQNEVEHHLNSCQGCREEFASLRAMVGLLHRMPQVSPSRSFAIAAEIKPLPRPRAFPALRAATAIVAVALVFLFASDTANLFESATSAIDQPGGNSQEGSQRDDASSSLNGGNSATDQEDPALSSGEESLSEAGWLDPLEYSLLGVAVILGGATLLSWRKKRHPLNRATR